VVAVLLSVSSGTLSPPAKAPEVGDDKAPDFLMPSTVEETSRLSDSQGKKNVVPFSPAAAFAGVRTAEALASRLDLLKYESLPRMCGGDRDEGCSQRYAVLRAPHRPTLRRHAHGKAQGNTGWSAATAPNMQRRRRSHVLPAVDLQFGARDIGRPVRAQDINHLGDLFWRAQAAERQLRHDVWRPWR
jgi:hypothetical protein